MSAHTAERTTTFRNTVSVHDNFGGSQQHTVRGNRVDATLTLEDGRTVQVGLLNDGRVLLRAWAADPYASNNLTAASVSFRLPTLEDMVLDGAQVSEVNLQTSAATESNLPSPQQPHGCWHLADQAIRDRVQGIRTLLALRDDTPTKD